MISNRVVCVHPEPRRAKFSEYVDTTCHSYNRTVDYEALNEVFGEEEDSGEQSDSGEVSLENIDSDVEGDAKYFPKIKWGSGAKDLLEIEDGEFSESKTKESSVSDDLTDDLDFSGDSVTYGVGGTFSSQVKSGEKSKSSENSSQNKRLLLNSPDNRHQVRCKTKPVDEPCYQKEDRTKYMENYGDRRRDESVNTQKESDENNREERIDDRSIS